MKVQTKQFAPGKWAIQLVSSVGVVAGKTFYPSAQAAEAAARAAHPDKEIEIVQ